LNSNLFLIMSAPLHSAERRLASMVAIIGNDAVLEAAPATPVQLAHACLRRGFSVAVPASWGDELVATETVRRLASRERGPAVMCVCPFVRSRLLAPGPDLAPFLVSLVAPPVATARYLRAAYGERDVHITYIGGCPSAEDPSIDERLTPDAFLADLAEHGIALAEQPLVFDSIVPPDRRRWCSLPGGTPTAETLWSDSDPRALIEIDRDDVSTDLAQHLITHEHVLLDLAPGLGCLCSGAVRSSPARGARAAVTALEPPRAPKSVVEPAPTVSLDAPVAEHVTSPPLVAVGPAGGLEERSSLESGLDELLGKQIDHSWTEVEPEIEVTVDFTVEAAILGLGAAEMMDRAPTITESAPQAPEGSAAAGAELAEAVGDHPTGPRTVPEPEATVSTVSTPESVAEPVAAEPIAAEPIAAEPAAPATSERPRVRRHAPSPMPVRYPTSAIPRATASDGKALPRAYVAKRRISSAGTPPIHEARGGTEAVLPKSEGENGSAPPMPFPSPATGADIQTAAQPSAGSDPSPAEETSAIDTERAPESTTAHESETSELVTPAPSTPSSDAPSGTPGSDQSSLSDSNEAGSAPAETDSSTGPLVALLVALLRALK